MRAVLLCSCGWPCRQPRQPRQPRSTADCVQFVIVLFCCLFWPIRSRFHAAARELLGEADVPYEPATPEVHARYDDGGDGDVASLLLAEMPACAEGLTRLLEREGDPNGCVIRDYVTRLRDIAVSLLLIDSLTEEQVTWAKRIATSAMGAASGVLGGASGSMEMLSMIRGIMPSAK